MKKSTDDLMNMLKASPDIEDFFRENDDEIFFDSLSRLLDFYRVQKGIKKSEVVQRSCLDRSYAYQLLNGSIKKSPSRDKVIMLCYGLSLDVEETQNVLKRAAAARCIRATPATPSSYIA